MADPERFDTDPDPTFYIDTNPEKDPSFTYLGKHDKISKRFLLKIGYFSNVANPSKLIKEQNKMLPVYFFNPYCCFSSSIFTSGIRSRFYL